MRIYTRRGDGGETGLLGGGRVSKAHPRVNAYGDVDELAAVLGWALTVVADPVIRERLATVQPDLFVIGAILAAPRPPAGRNRPPLPTLDASRVATFEAWIDEADAELPPLRAFIFPGGSPGGAALHVARTVCRRAERRVVALAAEEPVDEGVIAYLNRLSDLLFVFARLENRRAGVPEREWNP